MTKDKTVDLLERLILTGARTTPRADEPDVEGTSLHREDVRFILDELRARRRIEFEPTALEGMKKSAGKAAAAAPAGRSPTGATSGPKAEEEGFPEDSQVPSSRTRRLRSRLAKLAAQIARIEAHDSEQNGTKRNTIRENQQSPRSKGAPGAPRK
jgi:hypothetical protein